ncbi:hypothetical protein CC80DRAFT_96993 [Byssothecium circinans]|uniref:Uncharacterized protein n=1 Tax=Byssothecium circinans TaxID=147558 RepID=A0A6A5UG63_9PLEO|nr:hypothetical protein CC80DRAFT_96993 [Byssothecium circinans]
MELCGPVVWWAIESDIRQRVVPILLVNTQRPASQSLFSQTIEPSQHNLVDAIRPFDSLNISNSQVFIATLVANETIQSAMRRHERRQFCSCSGAIRTWASFGVIFGVIQPLWASTRCRPLLDGLQLKDHPPIAVHRFSLWRGSTLICCTRCTRPRAMLGLFACQWLEKSSLRWLSVAHANSEDEKAAYIMLPPLLGRKARSCPTNREISFDEPTSRASNQSVA